MPAPEHLLSILDQLGDGGTVAMAERVHALVEQARAGAIPTDVAALEQQISTTKAHFQRRCDTLTERAQRAEAEAERFRGGADSTQTVTQIVDRAMAGGVPPDGADPTPVPEDCFPTVGQLWHKLITSTREKREEILGRALLASQQIDRIGMTDYQGEAEWLRGELADARSWARHGYEIGQRSCTWSDHGVAPKWLTEDWSAHFPSDLVKPEAVTPAETEAIRQAIGEDRAHALLGCLSRAGIEVPGTPTIHDLIEASSLGEPAAVAARASVPLEVGQAIAARAMGRDEPDRPEDHDPDDDAPWEPLTVGAPPETVAGDDDIDWGDEPADSMVSAAAAGPAAHREPCVDGSVCGGPHCPPPVPTNAEIRAWCREHGVSVSSVGAINKAARRAYDDAHKGA